MKNLKEGVKLKGSGGMTDIFDDAVKQLFNITDDEYDFICENATDDDLDLFLGGLGGLGNSGSLKGLVTKLLGRPGCPMNLVLRKFLGDLDLSQTLNCLFLD